MLTVVALTLTSISFFNAWVLGGEEDLLGYYKIFCDIFSSVR